MEICPNCGFKYMISHYEGEAHAFFRCPNQGCYKMTTRRKQLKIRGRVFKKNGIVVEVNTYDGEIK